VKERTEGVPTLKDGSEKGRTASKIGDADKSCKWESRLFSMAFIAKLKENRKPARERRKQNISTFLIFRTGGLKKERLQREGLLLSKRRKKTKKRGVL